MTKMTELTAEQKAAIPAFVDARIAAGWRTGPLSEPEWQEWEVAARACYGYAGVPWPGVTVRVASPLVAAFAAPIADMLIKKLGAVDAAVDDAVYGAVSGAVDDAVDDAVGAAVGAAVRGAVSGAVDDAVHGAVGGAVSGAVDSAVRDAVSDAVSDAVDGAVLSADALAAARRGLYRYLSGQHSPHWTAFAAFFRDVCDLHLPGDLWDRSRAYETTQAAGNWYPYRAFTMVSDRPVTLHLEQVGERGWGSHRLHCESGPAIAWSNGDSIHSWHGTTVPAWVIEAPTVERIQAEANTEIRRCAIEKVGWDTYLAALGVQPVEVAADPGNPGHTLALYDLPASAQVYQEPVRLLVMRNASLDRDGTRRTYAETVPADTQTCLDAAAWQFGVTPDVYAQMARAT